MNYPAPRARGIKKLGQFVGWKAQRIHQAKGGCAVLIHPTLLPDSRTGAAPRSKTAGNYK